MLGRDGAALQRSGHRQSAKKPTQRRREAKAQGRKNFCGSACSRLPVGSLPVRLGVFASLRLCVIKFTIIEEDGFYRALVSAACLAFLPAFLFFSGFGEAPTSAVNGRGWTLLARSSATSESLYS